MSFLEIKNLNFTYSEYDKPDVMAVTKTPTLSDINMQIEKGSFVTLCGPTGSGKSTLLKILKNELRPQGLISGYITLDDQSVLDTDDADTSAIIGLLFQNPEDQCVADKVWHEIIFGLENLGYSQNAMEKRLAEVISFFRLESIAMSDTSTLSGGQKQLVNLASLVAMNPKLLLLDEPFSALDPEATQQIMSVLLRLKDELGFTIILAEHNLAPILPYTDTLFVMNEGHIIAEGSPTEVFTTLGTQSLIVPKTETPASSEVSLKIGDLYFKYDKAGKQILNGVNTSFLKGSISSVMGCNASGKSTLLNLISGILKPTEGAIKLKNGAKKISYLPQNVELLFAGDSLKEEYNLSGIDAKSITGPLSHHDPSHSPYDLSGGEKQLLGLEKVLSSNPDILLLDEPTRGMDFQCRQTLCNRLIELRNTGMTIILSTHDIDFAGAVSDYCSLMSCGKLTKAEKSSDFFSTNILYKAINQPVLNYDCHVK